LQHTIDVQYLAVAVDVTRVDVAGVGALATVDLIEVVGKVGKAVVRNKRVVASATEDEIDIARADSGVYAVSGLQAVYLVGRPEGGALVDVVAIVRACADRER